ncbi:hypothetical protein [Streptomyces sp. NPDC056188]|uniref:hypothetical protein n=1 Tax=Streptomyces sp. NPDC056188 TaxID=3345740 RepID=UPI0035D79007
MGLSTSSKATTAAAAGILAIGITVIARGAADDDLSDSICGACLIMMALSTGICVLVRHWVVATGDERRVLAAALRQTQAERTRYIAAQAGLENERSRLSRDMAAERARITATLAAERAQLEADFEEQRAQLAADSFRTGVEMERAGMLKPGRQPVRNNLIQFPERTPERARSREHGGAVP